MDPDLSTGKPQPRKVRFAPKAPPKREQKPVLPKVEKHENEFDAVKAEELLHRYRESSFRGKPKVERKVGPVKVAFGYGGSSSSFKSYGSHKGINKKHGGVGKEYKEPWDYYNYYPVTHPLRRPYSGNPELIDKEEFGEDGQIPAYDEYSTNPAAELDLLDENMENSMFFFGFRTNMPTLKQPEVNESKNNADDSKVRRVSQKPCNLEALPSGLMGKMLVYKSGVVKLKLGDAIYDVSPGLNCVFAQDVFAMNTEEKYCCNMGEISKRAFIIPDIDTMLNDTAIIDTMLKDMSL